VTASRKSSSKAKPTSFADRVKAHAAKSSTDELAKALGDVAVARLKAKQHKPKLYALIPVLDKVKAVKRRSARRLGKFQRYHATSKPDYSRPGTFRTYMIATIRAHTDTHSANAAHALCEEPSFAKNRLDFNWAADNGYIEFD